VTLLEWYFAVSFSTFNTAVICAWSGRGKEVEIDKFVQQFERGRGREANIAR